MSTDYDFMNIALTEAEEAYRHGEVPVGAVLVRAKAIFWRGRTIRLSRRMTLRRTRRCWP